MKTKPFPFSPFSADDKRWQAVVRRDRSFDGQFVYGVRSTGIYCRPSCASRQPRPENVAFFATPAGAEAAGLRACKRCRPLEADPASPAAQLVEQARALIAAEGGLALPELGRRLHSSPTHLQRLFKAATGLSPRQYAAALRLEQLKSGLRQGQSVTRAAYQAGYGSSSRVYAQSNAGLGMTPAAYRQGGKEMEIRYTLANCPLGRLLVAATERGVCAVAFGDDDSTLEAALGHEYPAAHIRAISNPGTGADSAAPADALAETNLQSALASLQACLESGRPLPGLALDVNATAFQLQVWEELRRIPAGETRTYAQVARAIGRPSAMRAVANACGANPTALLTPCHRVVRSDGAPGGYRWGMERKKILLELERQK